jgi:hypothetical protein
MSDLFARTLTNSCFVRVLENESQKFDALSTRSCFKNIETIFVCS